jgi:threonine aldolase
VKRLADDHDHARTLAAAAGVDPAGVETNIVVIPTDDAPGLVTRCRDEGVLVSAVGPRVVRAVTHLDVNDEQTATAADVIGSAVAGTP